MKNHKLVRQFMDDVGYTNITGDHIGIKKNHKKGGGYTYKKPEEMLDDFIVWQKKMEWRKDNG